MIIANQRYLSIDFLSCFVFSSEIHRSQHEKKELRNRTSIEEESMSYH